MGGKQKTVVQVQLEVASVTTTLMTHELEEES